MFDLKILTIRDNLLVSGVVFAQNISPLSIVVTGENFDQASKILINGVESPEHVIVSATRLIAQVPDSERANLLTKIVVLADTPSAKRSSILSFEAGEIKGLQGLERLVQLFCKILIQTPGSDRFDPNKGGGLLSLIGLNVSKRDTKLLQASVVGAVGRTKEQILAAQAKNRRIPSSERLLSAAITAVGFDSSTATLTARVSISAASGSEAVANLTF